MSLDATNRPDTLAQTIRAGLAPSCTNKNSFEGQAAFDVYERLLEERTRERDEARANSDFFTRLLSMQVTCVKELEAALDEAWQQYGYCAAASLSVDDKDAAWKKLGSILARELPKGERE